MILSMHNGRAVVMASNGQQRCRLAPMPMRSPFMTPPGCPYACLTPGSHSKVLRACFLWWYR